MSYKYLSSSGPVADNIILVYQGFIIIHFQDFSFWKEVVNDQECLRRFSTLSKYVQLPSCFYNNLLVALNMQYSNMHIL